MHITSGPWREEPIEWGAEWRGGLLSQRSHWIRNPLYSKPLLGKLPMQWTPGFHATKVPEDSFIRRHPHLRLAHLHHLDRGECMRRVAVQHKEYETLGSHRYDSRLGAEYKQRYDTWLEQGKICNYANVASVAAARGGAGGNAIWLNMTHLEQSPGMVVEPVPESFRRTLV
eukprot:2659639-Prymnesium_polylepis.1